MAKKENEREREASLFPAPFSLKEKDKERERSETGACTREEGERIDVKRFIAFFNDTMARAQANIPPIRQLSTPRLIALRTRCKEYGKGIVCDVITKAAHNPFLNGCGPRGWCANFDWLMAPGNFLKVLEGNYDHLHRTKKPTPEEQEARRAANRAIEEQIHQELHESIRRREQNAVTYEEYRQMLREGRLPQAPTT